jgi:hypothetical protein
MEDHHNYSTDVLIHKRFRENSCKNRNFLRILINERKAPSSLISHTLTGTQTVRDDAEAAVETPRRGVYTFVTNVD